ncbi:hypothetical protein TNCV_2383671 [Trichonephila clavipes]|nr:hypothetical protein TNCV_2383671 [Trichonephila clavipes]
MTPCRRSCHNLCNWAGWTRLARGLVRSLDLGFYRSQEYAMLGDSRKTLLVRKIGQSSRAFVLLGRPNPPRRYPFRNLLLPTPSNYHITPTEVAADLPIRLNCFYRPTIRFL